MISSWAIMTLRECTVFKPRCIRVFARPAFFALFCREVSHISIRTRYAVGAPADVFGGQNSAVLAPGTVVTGSGLVTLSIVHIFLEQKFACGVFARNTCVAVCLVFGTYHVTLSIPSQGAIFAISLSH